MSGVLPSTKIDMGRKINSKTSKITENLPTIVFVVSFL